MGAQFGSSRRPTGTARRDRQHAGVQRHKTGRGSHSPCAVRSLSHFRGGHGPPNDEVLAVAERRARGQRQPAIVCPSPAELRARTAQQVQQHQRSAPPGSSFRQRSRQRKRAACSTRRRRRNHRRRRRGRRHALGGGRWRQQQAGAHLVLLARDRGARRQHRARPERRELHIGRHDVRGGVRGRRQRGDAGRDRGVSVAEARARPLRAGAGVERVRGRKAVQRGGALPATQASQAVSGAPTLARQAENDAPGVVAREGHVRHRKRGDAQPERLAPRAQRVQRDANLQGHGACLSTRLRARSEPRCKERRTARVEAGPGCVMSSAVQHSTERTPSVRHAATKAAASSATRPARAAPTGASHASAMRIGTAGTTARPCCELLTSAAPTCDKSLPFATRRSNEMSDSSGSGSDENCDSQSRAFVWRAHECVSARSGSKRLRTGAQPRTRHQGLRREAAEVDVLRFMLAERAGVAGGAVAHRGRA